MKKQKTSTSPIEETYETEITYDCPVRGKVTQKVTVTRLKPVEKDDTESREILPIKNLAVKLDSKFSGLILSDDSLEDEQTSEDDDVI